MRAHCLGSVNRGHETSGLLVADMQVRRAGRSEEAFEHRFRLLIPHPFPAEQLAAGSVGLEEEGQPAEVRQGERSVRRTSAARRPGIPATRNPMP